LKKSIVILFLVLPVSVLFFTKSIDSADKDFAAKSTYQRSSLPGEKVYKQYCISCHQADGGGVPNMNPPLINTTYVLGDKERLIKIVLKGLNENIEIDGETFTNPMPALSILKDQQIADVLTYVRNSFGNKASAVSASEVKAVRAKIK
jgi:mono/diheme cytochrome c family protein